MEWFVKYVKPCKISRYYFLRSEWETTPINSPKVSVIYLLWRGAFAVFCVVTVIHSIVTDGSYWLVYLTHWSIVAQLIYGLLFVGDLAGAVILQKRKDIAGGHDRTGTNDDNAARVHHRTNIDEISASSTNRMTENGDFAASANRTDNGENTVGDGHKARREDCNGVEAVIWILFSVVAIIPYFVTIGYWTLVYVPDDKHPIMDSIYVHGFNSVFALIDTMVVAIPVHFTHVVYLLLFSTAYVMFSGIYELAGGSYPEGKHCIYNVLNWHDEPRTSIVCVSISYIVACVMYAGLWALCRFRQFLASKLTSTKRPTAENGIELTRDIRGLGDTGDQVPSVVTANDTQVDIVVEEPVDV